MHPTARNVCDFNSDWKNAISGWRSAKSAAGIPGTYDINRKPKPWHVVEISPKTKQRTFNSQLTLLGHHRSIELDSLESRTFDFSSSIDVVDLSFLFLISVFRKTTFCCCNSAALPHWAVNFWLLKLLSNIRFEIIFLFFLQIFELQKSVNFLGAPLCVSFFGNTEATAQATHNLRFFANSFMLSSFKTLR